MNPPPICFDLAKRIGGGREQRFDLLGLCHVRAGVDAFHLGVGFDGSADLLDRCGVAETIEDDVVAGGGQRPGDALANAAGRSGDDGCAGHGGTPVRFTVVALGDLSGKAGY